ncbi:MAG: hypothetical protein R3F60_19565 [bacterium]
MQSAITECNDLGQRRRRAHRPGRSGLRAWPRTTPSATRACCPSAPTASTTTATARIDWPDDAGCLAAGDPEETPPGVPLGPTAGFGHHGSCNTWNACNNAQTCANAACRFYGHGDALEFQEGLCQDIARMVPGFRCNLFAALPNNLDDDWANGCNIPVAYDILCSP